jgi:4-amino-4-deoxy-L-arabinose transferase-like glycosyltransferase
LWFVNLESHRLWHPDEGRYAEIAREMAVSGDWITPRLADLKYFEKPPFQYWATATAYQAFGVHEWTARLWPALAGLLAVIAIGGAGLALGGAVLGVFAALALAGTLWHAVIAQMVTLDSGLAFFLALGFAAFVIAQRPEATAVTQRNWMWVAWAAFAGATLSKGPVAFVLPAGALVGYTAITRDVAVWRRLHVVSGIALFLVLTVPWFVAVARSNDEFLQFFFVHEHFQRFLTEEAQRTGPWYYFIPLAIAGSLPWLAVLAYGTRRAWRDGRPNSLGFSWQRFALVWAAFVFLFFSASGSKLPSYILPMFAPLALVVGWLLVVVDSRTLWKISLPGAIVIGAITLVVIVAYDQLAPLFIGKPQPMEVVVAFGPWLKAALLVVTAGSIAAVIAFRRTADRPSGRFWGVATLSVSALAAVQLATAGFDAFSATRSTSAILRAAQSAGPFASSAPVYQVTMYDQTLPFYLGRPTTVVQFRDELALGIDAEPTKAIPTVAAWLAQWQSLSQGYAMMPPGLYDHLASEGVPMRLLARDSRRVIVSRQ